MEEFIKTYWPIVSLLLVQTGALIWWASKSNTKLDRLEADVADMKKDLEQQSGVATKMAVVEAKMDNLASLLERVEKRLDDTERRKRA